MITPDLLREMAYDLEQGKIDAAGVAEALGVNETGLNCEHGRNRLDGVCALCQMIEWQRELADRQRRAEDQWWFLRQERRRETEKTENQE